MRRLIGHPNSNYGRTTRGKTVTNLSARKKGSTPPGIHNFVKGG